MTSFGHRAMLIGLLTLAGCKAQPDAAPGNNAALVRNEAAPLNSASAATEPAPKPLPADPEIRKQLPGDWVYSEGRPDPKSGPCETDNFIAFEEDGTYADYGESGRWVVDGGTLILTATTTLPDPEAEDGEEKPIDPPHVNRWPMVELDGDVMRVRIGAVTQWMYRCPPYEKD